MHVYDDSRGPQYTQKVTEILQLETLAFHNLQKSSRHQPYLFDDNQEPKLSVRIQFGPNA